MAIQNDPWKLYQQLVERAWSDPAFRKRLEQDPKGTLQAEIAAAGLDITLPDEINFVADTKKVANFTLPIEGKVIC